MEFQYFTLYPVRCTCSKVLGHLVDGLHAQMAHYTANPPDDGRTATEAALDDIGLDRMCCRMNMLNPASTVLTSKYFTLQQKPRVDDPSILPVTTGFKSAPPGDRLNTLFPVSTVDMSALGIEGIQANLQRTDDAPPLYVGNNKYATVLARQVFAAR